MPFFTESTFGSFRWKMLKMIEQAVFEVNGTIFGGYVRDSIVHDHFADIYYKSCKSINTDDYGDPKNSPESYPNRMYQPTDVDCVIHPSKQNDLINHLKGVGVKLEEVFCRPACIYLPAAPLPLVHAKYTARVIVPAAFMKYIKSPVILIDMILDSNYSLGETKIPYGLTDFECHSIILSKTGYDICTIAHPRRKLEKIQNIIGDIIQFVAKPVTMMPNRITKMAKSGWKCTNDNYCVTCNDSDSEVEETCLHCLDYFIESDCIIKNNCCSGKYHVKCYYKLLKNTQSRYNNKDNCTMCRRKMPLQPLR